ncbi:MAG: hypothetical protein ACFFD4_34070 [Candidatus Odinarchaeota archaeon]
MPLPDTINATDTRSHDNSVTDSTQNAFTPVLPVKKTDSLNTPTRYLKQEDNTITCNNCYSEVDLEELTNDGNTVKFCDTCGCPIDY